MCCLQRGDCIIEVLLERRINPCKRIQLILSLLELSLELSELGLSILGVSLRKRLLRGSLGLSLLSLDQLLSGRSDLLVRGVEILMCLCSRLLRGVQLFLEGVESGDIIESTQILLSFVNLLLRLVCLLLGLVVGGLQLGLIGNGFVVGFLRSHKLGGVSATLNHINVGINQTKELLLREGRSIP